MNCRTCRCWSEMLAQSHACGPIEAMCLSDKSRNKGQYTTGGRICEHHEPGRATFGAYDDPTLDHNDPGPDEHVDYGQEPVLPGER